MTPAEARAKNNIRRNITKILVDPHAKTTHETSTRHLPLSTVRLIYERANVRRLSPMLQEEGDWALVRVFCTPGDWRELTEAYGS